MKTKYIIITLIIVLLIIFLTQSKEHAGSTQPSSNTSISVLSNEAVQNISKVYADTTQTATFNNINVTGNANINMSNLVPKGTVIAWSGDVTKIPETWALCDGQGGRPDLRGRFILGSGKGDGLTERKLNEKNGEENVTLSIAQIPAHSHVHRHYECSGGNCNSEAGYKGGGSFSSRANTDSTGGGQSHNNMPPYYVLVYIIKI